MKTTINLLLEHQFRSN